MKLADTHAHIYDEKFRDDFDEIMDRINNELDFVVSIGYDMESSEKSIALSEKYEKIYSVIGFHPTEIKKYSEEAEKKLEEMAKNSKVTAIGEIGLDYHWMEDPEDVQAQGFRVQMRLAEKVGKPVVIHTREALKDTLDILSEFPRVGGILHCYPGSYESSKPFLDRYYIGVGGTLTFKNNKKTKELVSMISMDRLVIETDCPYLTPVPFRGKRNEPIYTRYVAEEISRIKEIPVEEVVKITTENAKRIYGIK